jgi:hypothetical protein
MVLEILNPRQRTLKPLPAGRLDFAQTRNGLHFKAGPGLGNKITDKGLPAAAQAQALRRVHAHAAAGRRDGGRSGPQVDNKRNVTAKPYAGQTPGANADACIQPFVIDDIYVHIIYGMRRNMHKQGALFKQRGRSGKNTLQQHIRVSVEPEPRAASKSDFDEGAPAACKPVAFDKRHPAFELFPGALIRCLKPRGTRNNAYICSAPRVLIGGSTAVKGRQKHTGKGGYKGFRAHMQGSCMNIPTGC